jgi:hypothetical protein
LRWREGACGIQPIRQNDIAVPKHQHITCLREARERFQPCKQPIMRPNPIIWFLRLFLDDSHLALCLQQNLWNWIGGSIIRNIYTIAKSLDGRT